MSTPVKEIYSVFLSFIGDDDIMELEEELIEEVLYDYLLGATYEFQECKKDLSIISKQGLFYINSDLTLGEKMILARGMIIYWLNPKLLTQEVIKNKITDDDYSTKSPANLLDKLIKLRTTSENDLRARKIRYTWRGNNLNE